MTQSILIDNSILSHGELASPIKIEVPGWGNKLILLEAKSAQPAWLRSQIEALPTIARLAREGTFELYSYFELEMEHWRGPSSFPGNPFGNVFHGLPFKSLTAPLQRSLFEQIPMKEFAGKQSQTNFCEWLLRHGPELLGKPKLLERLTELQIAALRDVDRYRNICHSLAPTHYVDAMHLWTGELNNVGLFLTDDKTLINALSSNKHLRRRKLGCKPIYPEELLVEIGVSDREPLPFQYGRRYHLNGTPYD